MDLNNNYSTSRHTLRPNTGEEPEKIMVGSFNWAILICTILLVGFGIVMVFSASYNKYMYTFLWKSIQNALIGGVAMLVLSSIVNYNSLNNDKLCKFLYAVSVIGLIAVLLLGTVSHGAKRRIMGFQPSEFVKLFTIIILAHVLD